MGGGPGWQLVLAGVTLREPLLLSLLVSALLLVLAGLSQRSASALAPWTQAAFDAMREAVADIIPPAQVDAVLPFIGTLWSFVLVANLLGLIPGLSSPTRDLSVTAALAALVFVAVHVFGVRAIGWKAHLRHYIEPSIILLPFHLISELTRTLALAIRLFGNMMSLEMAALLVLLVAGLLVPVPLLLLHVIEALVQAYIFGILALIYIASALEASADDPSAAPPAAPDAISTSVPEPQPIAPPSEPHP